MAEDDSPEEICEVCRASMKLVSTAPKVGPFPELHTFLCDACGHVMTKEQNGD